MVETFEGGSNAAGLIFPFLGGAYVTISGPAVPVFCMYLVAAERQGVRPDQLNGTLQTDIFKEYIAQKEWLFPPQPHLRLIGDLLEYTDGSEAPFA